MHYSLALTSLLSLSSPSQRKTQFLGQSRQMTDQAPQWGNSIVLEYEARVEPFTALFVKDILEPIFEEEAKKEQKDRVPSLLDVGCGAGCGSLMALEKGFECTSTDVSDAMVERTRQRADEMGLKNIKCAVADGQNLSSSPLVKKTPGYNYALAAFSLIFFPEPAKGLNEIHQCLADGGRVLLTAWGNSDETPAFGIFPEVFQSLDLNSQAKPMRIAGSQESLSSLLEEAKFKDIKVVGPVSHNVHVQSPEEYFNRFAFTSPHVKEKLEKLDETKRAEVKAKVMELASQRGGQPDGSVKIPSMAYLAYGTKA